MRFAGSYHRPDKIFAAETIEPRGADYEMLPVHFRNSKLAFKFRLSVIVQRGVIPVIRLPWSVTLAVENIVSRYIYDFCVNLCGSCSKISGTLSIYPVNSLFFHRVLSAVYIGPCSTVDHSIGLYPADNIENCFFICDIQRYIGHFRYRAAIIYPGILRRLS